MTLSVSIELVEIGPGIPGSDKKLLKALIVWIDALWNGRFLYLWKFPFSLALCEVLVTGFAGQKLSPMEYFLFISFHKELILWSRPFSEINLNASNT